MPLFGSVRILDPLVGMDIRGPHGARLSGVARIASLTPSNIQVQLDISFLALCGVRDPLLGLDIRDPLVGFGIHGPLLGLGFRGSWFS